MTTLYAISERNANQLVCDVLPNENFDAIFAMSDEVLAGLFSAFTNLNISPKDYLIAAISSGVLPNFLDKNISIVKHDGFEVGKTTAYKILEKIDKKNITVETKYLDVSFHEAFV